MKSIRQLRNVLNFFPEEIHSNVGLFSNYNIDYDVFLPSIGKNLQRGFVWNIDQKREIIWSILMKRNIPRMAIIRTKDDVFQIIDGKQRLSSMIAFYKNDFTLLIEEKEYYYNELPEEYQRVIKGYYFPYLVVNEDFDIKITDQQKIDWFKFINFVGTEQDKKHLDNLK